MIIGRVYSELPIKYIYMPIRARMRHANFKRLVDVTYPCYSLLEKNMLDQSSTCRQLSGEAMTIIS